MRVRGLRPAGICHYGNTAVLAFFSLYFFLLPCLIAVRALLWDSGLRGREMPRTAFRLHRALTPRYEQWARRRLASGAASKLGRQDISGTEWPLFGSVFYLWATESLQEAWEKDRSLSPQAPKRYALDAIEAAAEPERYGRENTQEMKKTRTCPKCGSRDIIVVTGSRGPRLGLRRFLSRGGDPAPYEQ